MNKNIMPYSTAGHMIEQGDFGGYKVIAICHWRKVDKETGKVEGYWAAYRGLTSWTDEHITQNGDKISRECAELLFPSFAFDASGLKWNT